MHRRRTSSSAMKHTKTCDESKCLSTGLMPADGSGDDPFLFNCYAQGPATLYPYLCADDYIGVRIEDEDVTPTSDDLHYYTCCHTDQNDEMNPTRECQDPQEADPIEASSKEWTPTSACQEDSPPFPYGRKMTQLPGFPVTYVCCNVDNNDSSHSVSPANSASTTGVAMDGAPQLSEIDVDQTTTDGDPLPVPVSPSNNDVGSEEQISFCQSFPCENCTVGNNFLDLETMYCYNDFYRYPQVVSASGNTAVYQCCSVPPEDGVDSSFLVTSPAYRATVWTQFTLALIASFMASLLIASIGRSLYLAAKKNNSSRNTNQRRTTNSDYSAYNLYLVFLAIPDLAYNLFMLGIVTEEFFNGWLPENDALITISATTNQYMNAIIAGEVLILLRNTKDCKRYVPPSFQKAVIQFVVVTGFATFLGVLWLYILHYSTGTNAIRATEAIPAENYSIPAFYLLVVILPGIYLIWVCFEIWHKELLPKGEVTIGQNLRNQPGDATRNTEETSQPSLKNMFDKEIWVSFRKAVSDRFISNGYSDPRDNTNVTNFSGSSIHGGSHASVNETVVNSKGTPSNPTSRHDQIPPTAPAADNGRLNVLAMYFFRIILVFFFLWLPGMIMYYMGYDTDRNASGALHNLGLIFFSLQAIVSNGMAFTKPDVKKSIHDLWEEVANLFPCCLQQKEEVRDTPEDLKVPASQGNSAKKWQEADIETQIRELASGSREFASSRSFSHASNPSVSRVVTVQHEVANIDGIQVSQLTTHTISSFNSSSHRGGHDGNEESESETENNEHLDFAVPSPKISRKPKRTSLEKPSSLSSSTRSTGVRDSSSGGRRNSDSLIASPTISKKQTKRRNSSNYPSNPSDEAPMRRKSLNENKSPSGKSRKRRSSTNQVPGSDSPVGKWKNVISSKDILMIEPPIGSSAQRRGSTSHLQQSESSGSDMPTRSSGSDMPRRSSDSNVQLRRGSGSYIPGVGSPVAELRKKFNGNDNLAMKSPGARRAHRRGSGSHLCKLNASNEPMAQVALNSNSNDNQESKSPGARSMQRRNSDSKVPINKSPVAELTKKFNGNKSNVSKSPVAQLTKKINGNGSNVNKSPVAQLTKTFNGNESNVSTSPIQSPRSRKNVANVSIVNLSPVSELRKKFNEINNDYWSKSPTGERKTVGTNSGNMTMSSVEILKKKFSENNGHVTKSPIGSKKSPGNSTRRRLSDSNNNVGEVSEGESKRRNSSTISGRAKKSPGNSTRRRLSGSNNNAGEVFGRARKSPGHSRARMSGVEKHVGELPLGQRKNRISTFPNNGQPNEIRISGVSKNLSDSSTSMNRGTRGKKRISNSKSLSFDGTVTDNSMAS